MQLIVGAKTLTLEELLSKRGNPYWGLAEDDKSGGRRYASRGRRIPAQGDHLPTLVFLGGNALKLDQDPDRPSRFVDGIEVTCDGRQLLASVRVTIRRDGDWNVLASARLGRAEFEQRQSVTLPLDADEFERARAASQEAGTSFDLWLAALVRDAISSRQT